MKNNPLFMLLFSAIIIWSFASEAYSAEKSSTTKKTRPTQQVPIISKIMGKATSCNLRNSTITVSTNTGASLIITIDKNTSLTKGGKNIMLKDIKIGDVVAINYETKKGINIAKAFSVQEKTIPTPVPAKTKK